MINRRSMRRWTPALWVAAGVALGWMSASAFRAAPTYAQQGLPNSAVQRNAMISELRAANDRLESLQKFIESGNIVVVIEENVANGGSKSGK